MSSTMIRTNISVPEDLWNDVEQHAEDHGFSSKAEVVRVALKDYIYGDEGDAPEALLEELDDIKATVAERYEGAEEEIRGMRQALSGMDVDDRSFVQVVKRAREQLLPVLERGAVITTPEPELEWVHAAAISYLLRNYEATETVQDGQVLLTAPGTDPEDADDVVPLTEVV